MAFSLRRENPLEGLLLLGLAQLRSRDAAAAEKTFSDALPLSANHPEALNGMGLARLQRGHPEEALSFFKTALAQNTNYGPALLNAAIVSQGSLRDSRGALEKYRQYLALRPPPADAPAVKAQVQQLEQDLNPAPVPLTRSEAVTNGLVTKGAGATNPQRPNLAPRSEPVAKSIPSATGREPSRYAYKNPPAPPRGDRASAEKFFAQGSQSQRAHRTADALASYRAALKADPSYFEAYYNFAVTATEAGDNFAALSAYESGLALRPESVDARYNFALILRQLNYLTDAATEFEGIASYPTEARAHLALANIYAEQLRQPSKARGHYVKVLEADPHNAQAMAIRSWLTEHPL